MQKASPLWRAIEPQPTRETKGTRDFLKVRTREADTVQCGQKHFEAPGLELKVAVSAGEV